MSGGVGHNNANKGSQKSRSVAKRKRAQIEERRLGCQNPSADSHCHSNEECCSGICKSFSVLGFKQPPSCAYPDGTDKPPVLTSITNRSSDQSTLICNTDIHCGAGEECIGGKCKPKHKMNMVIANRKSDIPLITNSVKKPLHNSIHSLSKVVHHVQFEVEGNTCFSELEDLFIKLIPLYYFDVFHYYQVFAFCSPDCIPVEELHPTIKLLFIPLQRILDSESHDGAWHMLEPSFPVDCNIPCYQDLYDDHEHYEVDFSDVNIEYKPAFRTTHLPMFHIDAPQSMFKFVKPKDESPDFPLKINRFSRVDYVEADVLCIPSNDPDEPNVRTTEIVIAIADIKDLIDHIIELTKRGEVFEW